MSLRFVADGVNPDLTIRGQRGSGWHGPSCGEPVTQEIKNEILRTNRIRIVNNITRTQVGELTDSQLKRICDILREPENQK